MKRAEKSPPFMVGDSCFSGFSLNAHVQKNLSEFFDIFIKSGHYYTSMSELQQINQLFEEKEKTIKEGILREVEKVAEREMKLFEFELFYSLLLQNKETAEWVQEKRKKEWKKALEEAHGGIKKAMTSFAS